MSEEPQNPRIESSKRKIGDALELHQHMRASIGLNPFNILQRMKAGISNFKNQQAQQVQAQQNQASGGNPGNPSNPTGTQGQTCTNSSRSGHFGLGLLRPRTPQQPPPPTEEEKRAMVEQQKLKDLEDKKKLAREKQYRLDHLKGLSVDRT